MTEKNIDLDKLKNLIIHPKIGEILIQHRKITLDQLGEALDEQNIKGAPIGRILIEKGFIRAEVIKYDDFTRNIYL